MGVDTHADAHVGVGRERGFSEERVSEALGKLKTALSKLEEQLDGRDYLAGGFSLAYIAHAGNLVRLRGLEDRESYEAAV